MSRNDWKFPKIWGAKKGKPEEEGDVELEERQKTATPRRYKVIFHNDDYTTRNYVIEVLMMFFQKNESEATHLMLSIHHRGSATVAVYTREIAETKVAEVTKDARDHGMPLLVTAEPE